MLDKFRVAALAGSKRAKIAYHDFAGGVVTKGADSYQFVQVDQVLRQIKCESGYVLFLDLNLVESLKAILLNILENRLKQVNVPESSLNLVLIITILHFLNKILQDIHGFSLSTVQIHQDLDCQVEDFVVFHILKMTLNIYPVLRTHP